MFPQCIIDISTLELECEMGRGEPFFCFTGCFEGKFFQGDAFIYFITKEKFIYFVFRGKVISVFARLLIFAFKFVKDKFCAAPGCNAQLFDRIGR